MDSQFKQEVKNWVKNKKNTDRIIGFSDAIFAFAITLLVLSINIPEVMESDKIREALVEIWPRILVFIISFFVVGRFWIVHLRLFNYIKHLDYRLLWLDLFFLLFIVLTPFMTAMYGTHSSNVYATSFFLLSLFVTSILANTMWRYVDKHRDLTYQDIEERVFSNSIRQNLVVAFSFLACIAFSWMQTSEIHYVWIFYVFVNITLSWAVNKYWPYKGYKKLNKKTA